jgi:formamidopyrimidine-DNA glycosylase
VPELPEVEVYRRLAARVVGRQVSEVVAPDAWYLKRGLTAAAARAALEGRSITGVRRTGKVLLLETGGDGPVLGLRFGMSGRLVVDGTAARAPHGGRPHHVVVPSPPGVTPAGAARWWISGDQLSISSLPVRLRGDRFRGGRR